MPTVTIGGRSRQLSPAKLIGKGGEADVYDLGNGQVVKLFKRAGDPDYVGNVTAQRGAELRIAEHQKKLPAFPKGLPQQVIAPVELALDKGGAVAGYTMRFLSGMEVLLRYGDRRYREQGGIDSDRTITTFCNLHAIVNAVHDQGIVIGDFNDLNVLVDGHDQVYLVDADSMQFGGFPCRTFTARFVDPLRCGDDELVLMKGHNPESDWYAYATMLFQSLLYAGPYGGVHRPKGGKRLQHDTRVLRRITVFHPDVVYPKPAEHFGVLPDDLLQYFHHLYEEDKRGVFPLSLIQGLRWTNCSNCGAVHARASCPTCMAPGVVKEATVYRGNVTAKRVFRTKGRLVCVAYQRGKLHFLYHEDGAFKRESGETVIQGKLDPELRFRISGPTTVFGRRQQLLVFGDTTDRLITDTFGHLSIFDANQRNHFWIQNNQLVRNGRIGPEYIGDVLAGRTLFWAGERFGFGFYQAGELTRAFVFSATKRGLNDQVKIPTLPGQLVDTTCVFSDRLAWFFVTTQFAGQLKNHCYVIDEQGKVIAYHTADQEEDSWLASGIRGRFAAGSSLYVPTDSGIVRIDSETGSLRVAQEFPDTEPFVNTASHLLSGDGGIYVVSGTEITLLSIK